MGNQPKPKIERHAPQPAEGMPPQQGKTHGPAHGAAPAGNVPQDGGQGKQPPKKPKKGEEPAPSATPGQ